MSDTTQLAYRCCFCGKGPESNRRFVATSTTMACEHCANEMFLALHRPTKPKGAPSQGLNGVEALELMRRVATMAEQHFIAPGNEPCTFQVVNLST
jgi:hypothetical protein